MIIKSNVLFIISNMKYAQIMLDNLLLLPHFVVVFRPVYQDGGDKYVNHRPHILFYVRIQKELQPNATNLSYILVYKAYQTIYILSNVWIFLIPF